MFQLLLLALVALATAAPGDPFQFSGAVQFDLLLQECNCNLKLIFDFFKKIWKLVEIWLIGVWSLHTVYLFFLRNFVFLLLLLTMPSRGSRSNKPNLIDFSSHDWTLRHDCSGVQLRGARSLSSESGISFCFCSNSSAQKSYLTNFTRS